MWKINSDRCGYCESYLPRYNQNFKLNIMLHHVGMLWIIEIHEHLQYDIDKNISDWISGDP